MIALGAKEIETRSWGTSYRGPIAIHAGKEFPTLWRQFSGDAFVDALGPVCGVNQYGVPNLRELPTGCVLALATLVDCVPMVPPYYEPNGYSVSDRERAVGNYGPGRYAWILREVIPLAEPVSCRGRQRLWELRGEALAAVFEAAHG
jgi:hypothetical protein